MSIEEKNKAVVRRYFEESNLIQGDSSKVHILAGKSLAPEFVAHHSIGGDMNSEQWTASYEHVVTAFPNMTLTVINMVAEGDKVVIQYILTGTHTNTFLDIPATGKQVNVTGFSMYRIESGKIIEDWSLSDSLSMMQQLGDIPKQETQI
jgi:steroid delta-isomerase-like uncharacterized protein